MPSVATTQASIRHPSFGTLLAASIFLPFLVGIAFPGDQSSQILIPALLAALSLAVFLTAYSLWHLRKQHQGTDRAFRQADCEFASVFENVLDGILIVDDTGDCLDANPAATAILRLPGNELIGQNVSRFLEDAGEFAQGWKSFLQQKNHRGCTKLIAGDHTTVFVAFTATAQYLPGRHLLILCDVTERTQTELSLRKSEERFQCMAHNIQAARAEAEALRRATLALSQNLAMDSVLDTLLKCIRELIPFDKATVLFAEEGQELLVAREAPRFTPGRIGFTLQASENAFLECALFEKRAMLLSDVAREADWRSTPPLDQLRSWLGIPLLAAGHVQGILSLGSEIPAVFTTEHLRLAKSLAIPAAVAIQNARTHQRAEIYAAELEARLRELRQTQKALEYVEGKTHRSYEH
jgi:PAS domain S-box-containing protein